MAEADAVNGLRSSLGLTNSRDVDFVKKQAFHDQNILIINLDDPVVGGWVERQVLENIGTRKYGKREKT